ncbi:hypothetical protein PTKIN_Ptkin13bG0210300 [Pterospermum kingtungense]
MHHVSVAVNKKTVPVGPLVQDYPNIEDDHERKEIMEWLSKRVNFIWVIRFPVGEDIKLEEALPQGFLERIGERGLVVEAWAPQAKILQHTSIGGFVSHCGWGSVMESLNLGFQS